MCTMDEVSTQRMMLISLLGGERFQEKTLDKIMQIIFDSKSEQVGQTY